MIEKPESIRYPDHDEEDAIMALCMLQAEENAMFDVSEEMVRIAVRRALNYDRTIIGVIGDKGDLRGGLMVFCGQAWYSKREMLQELFNFVHPKHRSGKNYANDLIDFGRHLSDKMQIPLNIGVISNVRTEGKVRLYRRKLNYVGAFFNYNADLGMNKAVEADGAT